jgi:hypothetical protein
MRIIQQAATVADDQFHKHNRTLFHVVFHNTVSAYQALLEA